MRARLGLGTQLWTQVLEDAARHRGGLRKSFMICMQRGSAIVPLTLPSWAGKSSAAGKTYSSRWAGVPLAILVPGAADHC